MKTLALLLALLGASTAAADEVVLRNGATFSGVVVRDGDEVRVRVDAGEICFNAQDVAIIRFGAGPLLELERKIAAASTAQQMHDVAVFASLRGFAAKALELHRRAIETDPEHEGSRRALGHVRQDGRWLTPEELEKARAAARLELEIAEQREHELRKAELSRRISLDNELAELERRKVELERERLEVLRKLELRRIRLQSLTPPPPLHVCHAGCLHPAVSTVTGGGPPLRASR